MSLMFWPSKRDLFSIPLALESSVLLNQEWNTVSCYVSENYVAQGDFPLLLGLQHVLRCSTLGEFLPLTFSVSFLVMLNEEKHCVQTVCVCVCVFSAFH